MDSIYGYQVTNVESQTRNTSSLLHWTRRMIEVRKANPAFGVGYVHRHRRQQPDRAQLRPRLRRRHRAVRQQPVPLPAAGRARPAAVGGRPADRAAWVGRSSRRSASCRTCSPSPGTASTGCASPGVHLPTGEPADRAERASRRPTIRPWRMTHERRRSRRHDRPDRPASPRGCRPSAGSRARAGIRSMSRRAAWSTLEGPFPVDHLARSSRPTPTASPSSTSSRSSRDPSRPTSSSTSCSARSRPTAAGCWVYDALHDKDVTPGWLDRHPRRRRRGAGALRPVRSIARRHPGGRAEPGAHRRAVEHLAGLRRRRRSSRCSGACSPGVNPDIEVQASRSSKLGARHIPRLLGAVEADLDGDAVVAGDAAGVPDHRPRTAGSWPRPASAT